LADIHELVASGSRQDVGMVLIASSDADYVRRQLQQAVLADVEDRRYLGRTSGF
jgi:hypothetical protein